MARQATHPRDGVRAHCSEGARRIYFESGFFCLGHELFTDSAPEVPCNLPCQDQLTVPRNHEPIVETPKFPVLVKQTTHRQEVAAPTVQKCLAQRACQLSKYVAAAATTTALSILHILPFSPFWLKALYPNSVHMNRGNHEAMSLNVSYGFFDEVCPTSRVPCTLPIPFRNFLTRDSSVPNIYNQEEGLTGERCLLWPPYDPGLCKAMAVKCPGYICNGIA